MMKVKDMRMGVFKGMTALTKKEWVLWEVCRVSKMLWYSYFCAFVFPSHTFFIGYRKQS